MALIAVADLGAVLGRDQRVLGLDLGTKTIGLALSDITRMIATPMVTIRRTKFTPDAQRLVAIIGEQDVGALVLGLPISMDGSEGPRCQATRTFARNFLGIHDIPIVLWDERLSTSAVERVLIGEADLSRKRRAAVIDKTAAAFILQGVLDTLGA